MTITFFTLLVMVISAIFAQYKQLQILQQNSYHITGYFKWLMQSYTVQLALSTVSYCSITILLLKNIDWLALIVAILVLAARVVSVFLMQKSSDSKLVFTARAKRLYITAILLLFVSLFISVMTDTDAASSVEQIGSNMFFFPEILASEISRTVCILLSAVAPLLTVVIWLVTLPIEKVIAKRGIDTESTLDVAEESVEAKTDAQEETEQIESVDLSYEAFINNYDDDKGAKF